MSCSHTDSCPLFPLLNASLESWRRCYCNSDDGWNNCARYQLSLTGQRVPITLLPNGHSAEHLQSGQPAAQRRPAQPRPAQPRRISAQQLDRGPSRPAMPQQQRPSAAPVAVRPPRPAAPAAPAAVREPEPSFSSPAPAAQPAPRASLWARFKEWMTTPA